MARGRAARRGHERRGRRDLGHLVAPLDRPRHVLDSGPPGDLSGRRPRRTVVRLARAQDELRRHARRAGRRRGLLGLARAARRLGRHLGLDCDDRVGAARQLVAQRVRPRREGSVPTPHGPRPRLRRDRARRLPHRAARGGARREAPLARDGRGGVLPGDLARDDLGAATPPGDATARAGLQPRDPHGAAAVPAAARGARLRPRPPDAAPGPGPRLATLPAGRGRVPRRPVRHAVVLRRVPAVASRAELPVRGGSVELRQPPRPLALRVLGDQERPGDGARARDRGRARRRIGARRPVVGRLDGQGQAVSRGRTRILALAATAVVASAHVGSPDTYFEGRAGPYPVRVIIRNPGVVPGLAQITVRLLAAGPIRRVLVLPVYWDPRTAAPPPPDVARPVPGDSTLYSASLWLMRGGSYGVRVTVEGSGETGSVLVPVMAVATRRLELGKPLGAALLGLAAF